DPAGAIYLAGSTNLLDYPTTPGAFQPVLPRFLTCFQPCDFSFQGYNQYVSKVDPTGSKLIYSTSVSGGLGNSANAGIAVDASGAVYVTGTTDAGFPFSVAVPDIVLPPSTSFPGLRGQLPFLAKLDPQGQKLLFAVPAGGAGVQVDSHGAVYAGGIVGPESF